MPFQKGQSGNPSGRPKGFAGISRYIMERTNDAREIADYALEVWRDKNASMADRWAAHNWLADRCLGKAPLVIEAQVQSQNLTLLEMVNLEQLETGKLFELENILSSAVGEPLLLKPADDGDV